LFTFKIKVLVNYFDSITYYFSNNGSWICKKVGRALFKLQSNNLDKCFFILMKFAQIVEKNYKVFCNCTFLYNWPTHSLASIISTPSTTFNYSHHQQHSGKNQEFVITWLWAKHVKSWMVTSWMRRVFPCGVLTCT